MGLTTTTLHLIGAERTALSAILPPETLLPAGNPFV